MSPLDLLITPAYAQAASTAAAPNPWLQLIPLILLFVVFWFLLIRPQQKKQKEHNAWLGQLKRGDELVSGDVEGAIRAFEQAARLEPAGSVMGLKWAEFKARTGAPDERPADARPPPGTPRYAASRTRDSRREPRRRRPPPPP